jgi:hypothetical protein
MVDILRRSSRRPFQLRIDPELKAAFAKAAEAEHRPPSELVERFMRAYVRSSERRAFEEQARRQSREAAALSSNPESDDYAVMAEIEAELADVWGDP